MKHPRQAVLAEANAYRVPSEAHIPRTPYDHLIRHAPRMNLTVIVYFIAIFLLSRLPSLGTLRTYRYRLYILGQQQVTGQDVGGEIPAGQVTGMTRPGLVKTLGGLGSRLFQVSIQSFGGSVQADVW
ncbi:hypothetical protein F5878DRAFT_666026 [Lentinula raphanica]|uniref:Uncharacterized protein n=1 Tax=Lentinula raphanica TaxID=153919 RepID=A0AA38U7J1_9AGAR|nr:hypothetical protein F5878DRAFT_666026 [Lentinula raphanica]